LTPQHGVTLDTLLAAKVVTAEGIELQVSNKEHGFILGYWVLDQMLQWWLNSKNSKRTPNRIWSGLG
jgi:hypothetical protein